MTAPSRRAARAARWLFVGGVVLLVSAPLGYRVGLIALLPAFGAVALGFLGAAAAGVIALFVWLARRADLAGRRSARATALASLVVVASPLWTVVTSAGLPPIHDITTDVDDPPGFEALVPVRGVSANPLVYPGAEAAALQHRAYPDIGPIRLDVPPTEAILAAVGAGKALGWDVVAVDPDEGRIEATDTTFWFGFVDDVAVRVRPEGDGSRVDVRSVSRVGVGDLGANAKRIRAFTRRVESTMAR